MKQKTRNSVIQISKNKGTCVLCNQVFDHDMIESHLDNCIKNALSPNQTQEPLVDIFRIKMSTGRRWWSYIEVLANISLGDLHKLLKLTLIDDNDYDGTFHINDKPISKHDRPINFIFKKAMGFHYEYNPDSFNLDGKIVSCYQGYLDQKYRLLASSISPLLECNNCVCKPKFICESCLNYFCTKCLKKHPCGKNNAYLIND